MGSTPSPFMRAKVRLSTLQKYENSESLRFTAVCKNDGYDSNGLDENNTFAKFTPIFDSSMTVLNPALLNRLQQGDEFYVDFHLIPKPVKVD